jgi:hypothetical protein
MRAAHGPLVFDIAPQPLASALNRYGDLTGHEVLYDTALAQGRVSAATEGLFTPETALGRLLDGTGLAAKFMGDGSFVLVPRSANQQPLIRATPAKVQDSYYSRIQASLRNALCATVSGRPGHYRIAALIWIGSSGKVARYERLGTVGNSDLDRVIDQTLQDLQIGAPPPDGFRQPVLTMVVPKAPGVTMDCDRPQDAQRATEAKP